MPAGFPTTHAHSCEGLLGPVGMPDPSCSYARPQTSEIAAGVWTHSVRPSVSAIIVNYNGAHLLPECLASLRGQDYQNLEVLIVDNGSIDESQEVVKTYGNEFIPLGRNSGYAVACNRGAQHTRGEYVFFANMDMRFQPDCMSQLVAALATDADVFAADAMQYNGDGTSVIHFRSRLERIRSLKEFFSQVMFPLPPVRMNYTVPCSDIIEVPWGCGGSLMVRRSLFWALGGFDDSFFMDFEDADLCWRAWLRGWRTVFVPRARLYHKWGAANETPLRAAKSDQIRPRLESTDFRRLVSQQKNHLRFALKVLDVSSFALLLAIKVIALPALAVRRPPVAKAFVCGLSKLVRELPDVFKLRQEIARLSVRSSRELIARFIAQGSEAV